MNLECMKRYKYQNFSGIELHIIEDEIQNHFDNDVTLFGKNRAVLQLVEELTQASPSIPEDCPLKIHHYRTVHNDCPKDFFSAAYHYSHNRKSREFRIYKLIDRYFTTLITALQTNTNYYPEEWIRESERAPFTLKKRPNQSVSIMPLSWRNPEENALALISAIWLISLCAIKHYYPFAYGVQPTPKRISIVCDKGIETLLKVLEAKEYADTKQISKFMDLFSLKRTKDQYFWKRADS